MFFAQAIGEYAGAAVSGALARTWMTVESTLTRVEPSTWLIAAVVVVVLWSVLRR